MSTQKNPTLSTLSQRAIKVRLSLSQWTATRLDKKVTEEVEQLHKTQGKAGRYSKYLIAPTAATFVALRQAYSAARTTHYANTTPWSDDSWRLLATTNHIHYVSAMRAAEQRINAALAAFVHNYPALVSEAQTRLGPTMFDVSQYPQPGAIANYYAYGTEFEPVPQSEHLVAQIDAADIAAIQADIDARNAERQAASQRDLYERLLNGVARIAETLREPDAIFRDTLVSNLRELCGMVPRLMVTDDSALTALSAQIEDSLTIYAPDELRQDKALRAGVAAQAAQVQASIKSILSL